MISAGYRSDGLGGDSLLFRKDGCLYFYPIYDGVVMNVLGEIAAIEGYGDEEVVINERYYLGGSTLRGFEHYVGRDIVTADLGNRFTAEPLIFLPCRAT